ncbi:MAG: mechanosensitive ion channel protein MscS [Aquimarina sp.]|nr:mechanosensitive ion channel protein MscS [Aquimarina sp.]
MKEQLVEAWSKMLDKLDSWLDAFIINLPNIIIAIVVFLIVVIISRYLSRIIAKLLNRTSLQKSMKNLISKMISIFIIIVGLFLILGILNLSKTLNTILTGAGIAGLAVGLALQGALANTYSGIILSYIKKIKFGDWIESNGYAGEILDIDLRMVTIKQVDNNLVYIPNKMVIENPIKNYSTTSQSRVILGCGVGYESDLRFVKKLVIDTIVSKFDVVEEKEEVLFLWKEFGDSSINFELRFWIDSTSALEVAKAQSEAMMFIKEAFDNNDINIPFPIRTLDFPKDFNLFKGSDTSKNENQKNKDE